MTTYEQLCEARKAVSRVLMCSAEQRKNALNAMADAILKQEEEILHANNQDLLKAEGKIAPVMMDRLLLTPDRIKNMVEGIRTVAELPDPVGQLLESRVREDGLKISKVSVPLGVVAIIYESRPNVTADAAALTVKSGNVCVLRSGKEAHSTAEAIVHAMQEGLEKVGFPRETVTLVEDISRESANILMTANGLVDLLIPRGGKGLIKACTENATVPCIETGTGICHVYVDRDADQSMALHILENAKKSRPSVCNAAEVCLIDREILPAFMPLLDECMAGGEKPVQLRADKECMMYSKHAVLAGKEDFDTEFLDYVLAVHAVDGVEDAIRHIGLHSTGHSEAIITGNPAAAARFTAAVDSAAVYVNASTRFTDGGEFGLGCEMGISTQKLHARGPMGLREMTTYKYIIEGNGHIRR